MVSHTPAALAQLLHPIHFQLSLHMSITRKTIISLCFCCLRCAGKLYIAYSLLAREVVKDGKSRLGVNVENGDERHGMLIRRIDPGLIEQHNKQANDAIVLSSSDVNNIGNVKSNRRSLMVLMSTWFGMNHFQQHIIYTMSFLRNRC